MSSAPAIQHRMIDVGDGVSLHVVVSGEGRPVVLLHGFTGSAETWAALRGSLAAGHRVIAVDLPGHGRSTTPPDPARGRLSRLAGDLVRLLDALDVDRTALLGYSLGGRAALHFAARHAERLSHLVLESVSPGIEDPDEREGRRAADAALALEIEREGIESFVRRWESLPLWASQVQLPDSVRARLRMQRLQNEPAGLAASLRGAGAAAEPVLDDAALAFGVPTLLITGALDARYVAIAERLTRAIPASRRVVVDGAGHAVHLERPDEFAALVREFLRAR